MSAIHRKKRKGTGLSNTGKKEQNTNAGEKHICGDIETNHTGRDSKFQVSRHIQVESHQFASRCGLIICSKVYTTNKDRP